ncbi:MAG: hypothetical protein ACRDKI_03945 [Solirubrobacterales bacterium]
MIEMLTRVCVAVLGLAIGMALLSAAVTELSRHVLAVSVVLLLVIALRVVWTRTGL